MSSRPFLLPGGIRARLFLLIALVLLPMLGLQGWIYHQRFEVRRQQALQTEMEVAQGLATTFSAFVLDVRRLTFTTGRAIITFERYTREKATRLLQDAAAQHPALRNISWVARNGTVLASTEAKLVGADFSDRAYFRSVVEGAPWGIGPLTATGIVSPAPTFAIATAIYDEVGNLRGLVVAGIEPELLGEELFKQLQRPAGGRFAIFDGRGTVVYRGPELPLTWEERQRWLAGDTLLARTLQSGEAVTGIVELTVPGGRWLAARAPIPEFGWVAGAGRPLESALAPIRAQLRRDVALAAFIAAAAFVLAWFVARTIATPLQSLDADARALGEGGAKPRDEPTAPAEIHRLRATVTAMAAGLLERAEALRESEERHRLVNLATNDVIWDWDLSSDRLFWNPALHTVFGYAPETVRPEISWWYEHLHPDDRQWVVEDIHAAIDGGQEAWTAEYRFRRADGSYAAVFDRGHVHRDHQGKPRRMVGSMLDLSERLRQQEALRQSEAQLRQLADALPQLVWITRPDGYHDYFNRRWHDYTGTTLEDTKGDLWATLLHPDDYQRSVARWQQSLDSGEPYQIEYRFRRAADGAYRWFLGLALPVRDGQGKIVRWFGTCTDIHDLKEAQEALSASEERYRTLFERMAEGFILGEALLDEAGQPMDIRFLEANRAFEQQAGLGREALGRPLTEVLPHLEQFWIDTYCRVALSGQEVRFENYNRDTNRIYEVFSFSPAPGRFAALFRDVTERKEAETRVRESAAGLREAQRIAHIGSWTWDMRTDEGTASDEMLRIYGFDPATQSIPRFTDQRGLWYPPEEWDRLSALAQRAIQTGESYDVELQALRKGQRIWLLARAEAVRDAEGDIVGLRGTVQDITERKRAEEELRRLTEELEQRVEARTAELSAANRELEAFAYTVSHDLRAPLRHIGSFTELLARDVGPQLDQEGQRYVRIIADASRRMGALIDDLLEFSRLGRATLSKRGVDLRHMVEEVCAELEPETAGRRIDWRIGALPTVTGDPVLLHTVLVNLLGNALKYSRERNPAVVEVGGRQEVGQVTVFVRDNGAGFDMRHADQLFGVFQRLHPQSRFEGTGIGLASVKRIVERHGGRVWAHGELDRGATFYFSLPNGTDADASGGR
jgi:PAS domain S-box-containing protein